MESNTRVTKNEFEIIKKSISNISNAKKCREKSSYLATDIPNILGVKLTNKCNLRCAHCYEWNVDGYHRNMDVDTQNAELDLDIFKKIMESTKESKSNLYLWGGEPLLHSHFGEIVDMISKDNRITAICTNGVLIDENIESIIKIGDQLELLIAVDGFEIENDNIRGKGVFNKVIKSIKSLLDMRSKDVFKGKISIHFVISQEMRGKMYDFVRFFNDLGVDALYICFPWYISDKTSNKMTNYYNSNLSFLKNKNFNKNYSWDAFKYNIDASYCDEVSEQLKKIIEKKWDIRVKLQPDLKPNEMKSFIKGEEMNLDNKERCLSISTRMDVLPNGDVSSCKHFPELVVGNIKKSEVKEVWHSSEFIDIRKVIDKELMPVCSKCNNLFLHNE